MNRTSEHVRSMVRNTVVNLLRHERIRTTVKKAKLVRRWAEKMITLGKRGTLHARRQALAFLRSKPAVVKLFRNVAPRYAERSGGYTRILRLGPRRGDGAEMAILELVGYEFTPAGKADTKAGEKKAAETKAAAKKEAAPKAKKKPAAKKAAAPKAKAKKSASKTAARKKSTAKKRG